ncbi:hypothetical protein SXCC_03021 [Gluconacetobacter sp. SXCC-1]|nr:hypothetical protein SXCC_03021 [Gluconacetobacter sp. SXCC-1]
MGATMGNRVADLLKFGERSGNPLPCQSRAKAGLTGKV